MVEGGGRGPVARRFYLATEGAERRTWELSSGSCSVGSDPSNDVVIDEPTVSRFHCELVVTDRVGPRVRDLGSKNGTWVNGKRASGLTPVNDGDEIVLGTGVLTLRSGRRDGTTQTVFRR